MKISKAALIILLCVHSLAAKSSHIVGGELFYNCTGVNSYHVVLKLYRDCSCTNCAPYADPEYITIFDSAGNVYSQPAMPLPPVVQLPPTTTNACLVGAVSCIEEADYSADIVLPASIGGYTIVYQRCCRNNGVVNLVTGQGATFTCQIPGTGLAVNNNSARFDSLPPTFVCLNTPLLISYSATDPDGDSLVYSLCDPYLGADGNCPDPSPNSVGQGCPTVPNAPPYAAAAYASSYSTSNFTNSPANINNIAIDPHTGILSGIPNTLGLFDITVCVGEYRNGHLINTLSRDFEFTVSPCTGPIATIEPPVSSCRSLTVSFVGVVYYYSPYPLSYLWNFGVAGSTTDTSTVPSPAFTYPSSGSYPVQLILTQTINGQTCSDTARTQLAVYPVFESGFVAQIACGDSLAVFTDRSTGTVSPPDTWLWDFGDGATSAEQNPVHIYSASGNYLVQLIARNNDGCVDTTINSIMVQYPCVTNINDVTDDAATTIRAYPNPAKENITFSFSISNNQQSRLEVYDQLGQLVTRALLVSGSDSRTINTTTWAGGVYSFRIICQNSVIRRGKFIVIK